MSFSTLHDLLPRHFHATKAACLTRERKKSIHENNLAKAAVPHVERMIAEIEQAAARGCGHCTYSLETESEADIQILEYACNYLKTEGYAVGNTENISCIDKNKRTIVISWLD